jgi:hypothetical protein
MVAKQPEDLLFVVSQPSSFHRTINTAPATKRPKSAPAIMSTP